MQIKENNNNHNIIQNNDKNSSILEYVQTNTS